MEYQSGRFPVEGLYKASVLRTYRVPRVHEKNFIKEVGRLVNLGVLEEANNFEWGELFLPNQRQKRITPYS